MKIIIIGSSTGGPRTLFEIFTNIPKINASIIIVQHMPFSTTIRLAKRLSQHCDLRVIVPESGNLLEPCNLYIAPGDFHLSVLNNERLLLDSSEKINFVRPSIDVTMLSLKAKPDDHLTGIILSGMGCDGAEGMAYIKRIGGQTIVQNPDTCVIKSMPEAAIKTGRVDRILTPEEIHNFLISLK